MPYFGDPVGDTMGDRIEIYLRSLLASSADLSVVQVFYRGDPGIVPVRLHPFCWVFLSEEREATGESGYAESTGMRHFYYDGELNFEVLFKDSLNVVPVDRLAEVPSYMQSKELTQAGVQAVMEWGGPTGNLEENPVTSFDDKEMTVEFRLGSVRNGLQDRVNNVTNRGSVDFRVYTRRLTF